MRVRLFRNIFLIAGMMASAHAVAQLSPLHVGDTCPDFTIKNLINYPGASIKLSDLRGRVVLIDFWSTWCSSCIALLPEMERLQKKYGDSIFILPVTGEKRSTISKFWRKNRLLAGLSLPTVVEDTLLNAYFPHSGVPHEVWIDAAGVVRGITSAQYVNDRNIQALFDNQIVNWPVKRDIDDSFDYGQQLLSPVYNDVQTGMIYYSTVMPYLRANIRSKYGFTKNENSVRLYIVNYSILQLYNRTLKFTGIYGRPNRIILHTHDSVKYIYDPHKSYYESWHYKNAFCYEAVLPSWVEEKKALDYMRKDLDKFFNLNSRIEDVNTSCLLLIQAVKGRVHPVNFSSRGKGTEYTLKEFVHSLNAVGEVPPVILSEGLSGKIVPHGADKSFWGDVSAIRNTLLSYGFDLKPVKRKIPMLVVTDNR